MNSNESGEDPLPGDLERARQPGRGRKAAEPSRIPPEGWKDVFWRVFWGILEHRVLLIAAGVTFYLLLALVPMLSSFISIYGLFTSPDTALGQVQMLRGLVPQSGLDIIRVQMLRLTQQADQSLGLTLLISLVAGFWSAGAGVRAMFEAMNIVYHEREKRNFVVVIGITFLFTIAGTVAAVIVVAAMLVMPAVLDLFPFGHTALLIRVAGYGVMLLVVVVGLNALYRWGPSRRDARWRWITPGTVLSVVATLLTSLLFSWYAATFANFDATYGSLGAIIGFLLWVWLSMAIVIIGGSLNSEIEHQTARDTTAGPREREMGRRGAYVADTVGKSRPKARIRQMLDGISHMFRG